jgi:hypothetical protein
VVSFLNFIYLPQPDKDLSRSEPILNLKEVEVTAQDVELLPQIINELEAEKAAMDQQVTGFYRARQRRAW